MQNYPGKDGLIVVDPVVELKNQERYLIKNPDLSGIERVRFLFRMGWNAFYSRQKGLALEYWQECRGLLHPGDSIRDRLNIEVALAIYYLSIKDFSQAWRISSLAEQSARAAGDRDRECAALSVLTELYIETGDLSRARECADTALDLASATGNPQHQVDVRIQLAELSRRERDEENSLRLLDEALLRLQDMGDIEICRVLNLKGICLFRRKEETGALQCFRESIRISSLKNTFYEQDTAYYYLAEEAFFRSDYTKASEYIRESFRVGRKNGNLEIQKQCLSLMKRDARRNREWKKAMHLSDMLLRLQEKLHSLKSHSTRSVMYLQYELNEVRKAQDDLLLRQKDLEESRATLVFINDIAKRVNSTLDLDELSFYLYEKLQSIMDLFTLTITLYDSENRIQNYRYIIEGGERKSSVTYPYNPRKSLVSRVIETRSPLLLNSRKERAKEGLITENQPFAGMMGQSTMAVPLVFEETLIGVMMVQSLKENQYGLKDLEIFNSIAGYVSLTIRNSLEHEKVLSLNEQLQKEMKDLEEARKEIHFMATHDTLTGLSNRYFLNEYAEKTLALSRRENKKVAVVFIDVDNLKPVNDRYGHDAGDYLIRKMADRIKQRLRTSDSATRIGGDEMLLMIQGFEDRSRILPVAGDLHRKLTEPFQYREEIITPSVSIGISVYPDDGGSMKELVEKADTAMYKAKKMGKGRIEFHRG